MQLELDDVLAVTPVPTPQDEDDVLLLRADGIVAAPMSSLPGFLKGMDGANGRDGQDGKEGSPGKDGLGLQGPPGAPGSPGEPGTPGAGGRDGRDGVNGLGGLPGAAGEGFQWRGQYSRGETYQKNDVVRFSGSAFVCLKDSQGVMPSGRAVQGFGSEDPNWDIMAVQGDSGPAGTNGTIGQGVKTGGTTGQVLSKASNTDYDTSWTTIAGTGTVTDVSVVTANGVSGSVATSTSTPAITLTLGAITPTSVAAVGAVTGSNLSGTNTGNQTITLTSDVTGSGTGSFATTIAAKAVTLAKMDDVVTTGVFYRKTAGTGAPEVNTLATLKTDLGLTGTNSGDQTITLTGDVTGSGTGSFATTVAKITGTTVSGTTGTTNVVFSTSPTLTTPVLGVAAATTVNKVTLTTPATGSTLTIQDGFTLTANGNATVSGTNTGDQTITLTGDVTGSGTGSFAATVKSNLKLANIAFVIDGGGSVITTGMKGYLEIPFDCTINRATLLADQSGSIVVDIFKCTYSQFDAGSTHPVSGDKITASAPPTISTATKAQDATLTGWTTTITAGDVLAFNVNSITTCQRVTLSLKVTKT